MADHMRTDLMQDGLRIALECRKVTLKLLHRSERGCQYARNAYLNLLAEHGQDCNKSLKDHCSGNAVIENLFGRLTTELIHSSIWPTRRHTRLAIYEYSDVFYNSRLRHSHPGYPNPARFKETATAQSILLATAKIADANTTAGICSLRVQNSESRARYRKNSDRGEGKSLDTPHEDSYSLRYSTPDIWLSNQGTSR